MPDYTCRIERSTNGPPAWSALLFEDGSRKREIECNFDPHVPGDEQRALDQAEKSCRTWGTKYGARRIGSTA